MTSMNPFGGFQQPSFGKTPTDGGGFRSNTGPQGGFNPLMGSMLGLFGQRVGGLGGLGGGQQGMPAVMAPIVQYLMNQRGLGPFGGSPTIPPQSRPLPISPGGYPQLGPQPLSMPSHNPTMRIPQNTGSGWGNPSFVPVNPLGRPGRI